MEHTEFDKAIKKKLSNLEGSNPAADWQHFEKMLDRTGEPNALSDIQFDAIIANKLGAFQPTTQPTGWEKLEQALDQAIVADAQFDAQISGKLQATQPVFQPNHWQLLLNRLNTDWAMRENLYRHKLIEVVLMLLLLLNFYQYLPDGSIYSSSKSKSINNGSQGNEGLKENDIFLEPILETNPSVTPNQNTPKSVEAGKEPIAQKEQAKVVPPAAVSEESTTSNSEIQSNGIARRHSSIVAALPSLQSNFDKKTGLSISMSEMNQHLANHKISTGWNLIAPTIPSLQAYCVETEFITPLDCETCKHSRIPAKLRVGMYNHIAHNDVYRIGDPVLDISANIQKGFGYGSGISLGFKYGRWELETGLAYANKQYDPKISEIHGSLLRGLNRTDFTGIHLQTLQIPTNVRFNYAIAGEGKWHFYAQGGAALNIIMIAEYDFTETIVSNGRSNEPNNSVANITKRKYNYGLFAGDGLKDNRYLTINMGFGAEYYWSYRWSVFLQPDFHYHFSGNRIGPNQDRINTVALSLGVRSSL